MTAIVKPPFNGLEFGIVAGLFALITVIGFLAARWRRGATLANLNEWGLGGRRFGGWVTWFLVGGDLYSHRGAGARSDHGDLRRAHLHPGHLQALPAARR